MCFYIDSKVPYTALDIVPVQTIVCSCVYNKPQKLPFLHVEAQLNSPESTFTAADHAMNCRIRA